MLYFLLNYLHFLETVLFKRHSILVNIYFYLPSTVFSTHNSFENRPAPVYGTVNHMAYLQPQGKLANQARLSMSSILLKLLGRGEHMTKARPISLIWGI